MTQKCNHQEGPLATARATFLPTCREMSRHTSRALDGPLPLFQRLGVGLHLCFCRFCRRYWKQLRWLRRVTRKSALPVAPRLSEAGRSRLKHSLRTQTGSAAQGPSDPNTQTPPHEHGHDFHS